MCVCVCVCVCVCACVAHHAAKYKTAPNFVCAGGDGENVTITTLQDIWFDYLSLHLLLMHVIISELTCSYGLG